MEETWRNSESVCACKTSFSRLRFWFILISFQNYFPKFWVAKLRVRLICECGLYAGVYGTCSLIKVSSTQPRPQVSCVFIKEIRLLHQTHIHSLYSTLLLCSGGDAVASWLVYSTLDWAVWVWTTSLIEWSREHCVAFLSKTLYFHNASLHPGV